LLSPIPSLTYVKGLIDSLAGVAWLVVLQATQSGMQHASSLVTGLPRLARRAPYGPPGATSEGPKGNQPPA